MSAYPRPITYVLISDCCACHKLSMPCHAFYSWASADATDHNKQHNPTCATLQHCQHRCVEFIDRPGHELVITASGEGPEHQQHKLLLTRVRSHDALATLWPASRPACVHLSMCTVLGHSRLQFALQLLLFPQAYSMKTTNRGAKMPGT